MAFENRIKEVDLLQQEITKLPLPNVQVLKHLAAYYKIGLTYSSNALEGNSLTETETKIILEDGITIGGKPMREHLEALGHSKAYDFMLQIVKKSILDEADICKLHYFFYYMIDLQNAGIYRMHPIFVTGSSTEFPPPTQVPDLMKAFVEECALALQRMHPLEFAAWAHIRLVTIHPFVDGNGRTARLLMNLVLLKNGYVIASIPPILRRDYLSATQAGNKGDMQPFVSLLSQMVYEGQKDYMRMIKTLTTY